MIVLALIGAKALYLLFAWLISGILSSAIAERKGLDERIGIAAGLLLLVVGVLIVLVLPAREGSLWREEGPLPWRRR